MKKILLMLLILSMMLTATAFADDTGIQVIGGPEPEAETVNMDDWKEGDTVKISDFADITLESVKFVDSIRGGGEWGWTDSCYASGSESEYLRIRLFVLNTKKNAFNYLKVFGDVICDFGDGYQYAGWKRQELKYYDKEWILYEKADQSYDISPLYSGYFDVVVTLPNYVVESKEPLSVTFTIGENEFTINARK